MADGSAMPGPRKRRARLGVLVGDSVIDCTAVLEEASQALSYTVRARQDGSLGRRWRARSCYMSHAAARPLTTRYQAATTTRPAYLVPNRRQYHYSATHYTVARSTITTCMHPFVCIPHTHTHTHTPSEFQRLASVYALRLESRLPRNQWHSSSDRSTRAAACKLTTCLTSGCPNPSTPSALDAKPGKLTPFKRSVRLAP
jgi:hypothetical protein